MLNVQAQLHPLIEQHQTRKETLHGGRYHTVLIEQICFDYKFGKNDHILKNGLAFHQNV